MVGEIMFIELDEFFKIYIGFAINGLRPYISIISIPISISIDVYINIYIYYINIYIYIHIYIYMYIYIICI